MHEKVILRCLESIIDHLRRKSSLKLERTNVEKQENTVYKKYYKKNVIERIVCVKKEI